MAACVHHGHFKPVNADLADLGCIGQARAFLKRQAIHIRADQNNRPVPIFEQADNACAAHFFSHNHARHGAQFLCHAGRGVHFLERQFGIAVKMIP